MKKVSVLLACAFCAVLLSGCVVALGNKDGKGTVNHPTVGQQLVDLKKAQDAGAITPDEYNSQRAKILEQK